jgi:hypothetical protein
MANLILEDILKSTIIFLFKSTQNVASIWIPLQVQNFALIYSFHIKILTQFSYATKSYFCSL